MKNYPLISVIIPVYNGEKFVESALESVFDQTYSGNIQIVVVDDGSTDETASLVKHYDDVEYIYQENKGVSFARNTGIEAAEGEFIAFLDADDIWKPEKLQEQIVFMKDNPEIPVTGTWAENFLESGVELPAWIKKKEDWQKLDDYIIPSTMVVRRSVFKEVGVFDINMSSGEDTDWLWRVNEIGLQTHIIRKFLVKRRFHGANLSWKYASESHQRLLWIARQSILRKSGKK